MKLLCSSLYSCPIHAHFYSWNMSYCQYCCYTYCCHSTKKVYSYSPCSDNLTSCVFIVLFIYCHTGVFALYVVLRNAAWSRRNYILFQCVQGITIKLFMFWIWDLFHYHHVSGRNIILYYMMQIYTAEVYIQMLNLVCESFILPSEKNDLLLRGMLVATPRDKHCYYGNQQ